MEKGLRKESHLKINCCSQKFDPNVDFEIEIKNQEIKFWSKKGMPEFFPRSSAAAAVETFIN